MPNLGKLGTVATAIVAATLLVVVREQTPVGARVIKGEVDKLARKLCLLSFDFRLSRGESKGTPGGVVRLLIATHFKYLCLG